MFISSQGTAVGRVRPSGRLSVCTVAFEPTTDCDFCMTVGHMIIAHWRAKVEVTGQGQGLQLK